MTRPNDLRGAALTYVTASAERMRSPDVEPVEQAPSPWRNEPLTLAVHALADTDRALIEAEIKRRRGLSACDMAVIREARRELRALDVLRKQQVRAVVKARHLSSR